MQLPHPNPLALPARLLFTLDFRGSGGAAGAVNPLVFLFVESSYSRAVEDDDIIVISIVGRFGEIK